MDWAHDIILLGGVLGLLSIFAGRFSERLGAPLLLIFLLLGMLAGEDGLGGIKFDDFQTSYLIGSVALVIILFEGGLKTERAMLKVAFWPALVLATIGTALTAVILGSAAHYLIHTPWLDSMLIGAVTAPTDAAAVAMLLRRGKIALPYRVAAALEVESGLNDPMSVFLTVALVEMLLMPQNASVNHALAMFAQEMGGGALIGIGGGYAALWLFRRLHLEASLAPVLALAGAFAVFGAAQRLETSGFLAVYLMAVIVGTNDHPTLEALERSFETSGWLAQIVLFLILGLLVNPHELVPLLLPTLIVAAVLIAVARPVATFFCLLPFRFKFKEMSFISWVGLRGAVPIYLTIIPVLEGARGGVILFGTAFVIVITSLIVQGWTLGPAARLLGFNKT
jgi:NhaP-type Na+/H+ and K+/H+ antiporter